MASAVTSRISVIEPPFISPVFLHSGRPECGVPAQAEVAAAEGLQPPGGVRGGVVRVWGLVPQQQPGLSHSFNIVSPPRSMRHRAANYSKTSVLHHRCNGRGFVQRGAGWLLSERLQQHRLHRLVCVCCRGERNSGHISESAFADESRDSVFCISLTSEELSLCVDLFSYRSLQWIKASGERVPSNRFSLLTAHVLELGRSYL